MKIVGILLYLTHILCVFSNEEEELHRLEEKYHNLTEVFVHLKESFNCKKQEIDNLQQLYKSTIERLNDKFLKAKNSLEPEFTELSLKNRALNYRYDPVAFDARLSHPQDASGTEETIVFDTVLTNVGNGYDKSKGTFEVPLAGTYLFSWTIASNYGTSIGTKLNVNGNAVALMHTDTGIQKEFRGSTTKVTILNLNRHDRVYIIISFNRGAVVSDDSSHSSFEGALLYTNDEI